MMKKNIFMVLTVLLLCTALMMVLSLAACGEDEAPAATLEPTSVPADVSAAPEAAEEPSPELEMPTATPRPTADASGMMTYASDIKGFSFQYNEKYIAMANPAGNAMIYAAGDVELPFCSVSIIPGAQAVDYLNEMAAAAAIELEDAIETAAGEPANIPYGERDIYYIFYTYQDKEAGGLVECAYYAENLASGDIVVYNSTALSGATDDVNSILKTAIETFKLT